MEGWLHSNANYFRRFINLSRRKQVASFCRFINLSRRRHLIAFDEKFLMIGSIEISPSIQPQLFAGLEENISWLYAVGIWINSCQIKCVRHLFLSADLRARIHILPLDSFVSGILNDIQQICQNVMRQTQIQNSQSGHNFFFGNIKCFDPILVRFPVVILETGVSFHIW